MHCVCLWHADQWTEFTDGPRDVISRVIVVWWTVYDSAAARAARSRRRRRLQVSRLACIASVYRDSPRQRCICVSA